MLQKLIRDLNARGIKHQTQESPMQYIQRISNEKGIEKINYVPLMSKLQNLLYASENTTGKLELQGLKKDLSQFKRAILSA